MELNVDHRYLFTVDEHAQIDRRRTIDEPRTW